MLTGVALGDEDEQEDEKHIGAGLENPAPEFPGDEADAVQPVRQVVGAQQDGAKRLFRVGLRAQLKIRVGLNQHLVRVGY